MTLFPETAPCAQGTLPEEGGHHVFWETFGHADHPAILLLHGGPGGGTSPRMPRLFDPSQWHIITMDQRGAGRSTPHAGEDLAGLAENTTAHLIEDIERLRAHLGITAWHVYGASWGATLALAYALQHPSRVQGLLLASVPTTSYAEVDFLYGVAGAFLPEAFEAFAARVPEAQTGPDRAAAYYALLTCGDPQIMQDAARAWCAWEAAVLMVDPRAEVPTAFDDPRFALGFARVVTHYFSHLGWLDPPLLHRAQALTSLPAILINSRLDLSCPVATAWALHKALPRSELVIVPGSLHGTLYGPLSDAIVDAGQRMRVGLA